MPLSLSIQAGCFHRTPRLTLSDIVDLDVAHELHLRAYCGDVLSAQDVAAIRAKHVIKVARRAGRTV